MYGKRKVVKLSSRGNVFFLWVSNSFMSEVSTLILIRNLCSWVLKFDVIWDQSFVSTSLYLWLLKVDSLNPSVHCYFVKL